MRVAIHRNLTTNKWVISSAKQTRNGERKGAKSGDISKGADSASLLDVVFVTCSDKSIKRIQANINNPASRAGREVVAYAIGTLIDSSAIGDTHISWNPLKGADFYEADSGDIVTGQTFSYASFTDVMKATKGQSK